jgi:small-conductance mechanosensitive channel
MKGILKTMIQLRIKNESDLYNSYDPTHTKIHDDVYRYLKSFCTDLEYNQHMHDTLQIITDEPIDEENFRASLLAAVTGDRNEFDRQIALNNRRATWDFIVGIGLSLLGVGLAVVLDQVLLAIITFVGTTAIRDGIVIQTTLNHGIKRLKKLLDPFSDLKIEVIRAGEESPH